MGEGRTLIDGATVRDNLTGGTAGVVQGEHVLDGRRVEGLEHDLQSLSLGSHLLWV